MLVHTLVPGILAVIMAVGITAEDTMAEAEASLEGMEVEQVMEEVEAAAGMEEEEEEEVNKEFEAGLGKIYSEHSGFAQM